MLAGFLSNAEAYLILCIYEPEPQSGEINCFQPSKRSRQIWWHAALLLLLLLRYTWLLSRAPSADEAKQVIRSIAFYDTTKAQLGNRSAKRKLL
jgi:hypothetical protein